MQRLWRQMGLLTSPRGLMGMLVALGAVGGQGGRGTLAYFSSTVASESLVFSSGQVVIDGSSVTPTNAAFGWSTANGGANCATLQLSGAAAVDTTLQAMAPGQFCVAKITIANTTGANGASDAWMRMRLVRDTTATDTTTQALNNRLKFYMSEYAAVGDQTADCTTANYRPTAGAAINGTDTTATGKSNSSIANGTNNRTALTSLGAFGKNIGQHPGLFAPSDTTASAYFQTGNPHTPVDPPLSVNRGLGIDDGAAGLLTDAAIRTEFASTRTAFNLVGNDEVTNPRDTAGTAANGTRAFSTNAESSLTAGQTRYYCAAIFFPSDTGVGALDSNSGGGAFTTFAQLNANGDNAARTAALSYRIVVTAAQKAGRSTV